MTHSIFLVRTLGFVSFVALASACAHTTPPPQELAFARAAFARAKAGPAGRVSPEKLKAAGEALTAAEQAYGQRPEDEVRDRSYVAIRRVEIAEADAATAETAQRREQALQELASLTGGRGQASATQTVPAQTALTSTGAAVPNTTSSPIAQATERDDRPTSSPPSAHSRATTNLPPAFTTPPTTSAPIPPSNGNAIPIPTAPSNPAPIAPSNAAPPPATPTPAPPSNPPASRPSETGSTTPPPVSGN